MKHCRSSRGADRLWDQVGGDEVDRATLDADVEMMAMRKLWSR
jgi:hypothetical protein